MAKKRKSSPSDSALPSSPWRNRIVGEGEERPDQLLANPYNWRVHPKTQQAALEAVLDEVGWVQRIIVNRRTGHVVDGHLRVALAISRNEPTVPVLYVDLSEEEERLVLATLDPIAAMAVEDAEKLAALLEDVRRAENAALAGVVQQIYPDRLPVDEIARAYGEPGEDDFWPVVRVKIPPDAFALYQSLLAALPGQNESEKFVQLLNLAAGNERHRD